MAQTRQIRMAKTWVIENWLALSLAVALLMLWQHSASAEETSRSHWQIREAEQRVSYLEAQIQDFEWSTSQGRKSAADDKTWAELRIQILESKIQDFEYRISVLVRPVALDVRVAMGRERGLPLLSAGGRDDR